MRDRKPRRDSSPRRNFDSFSATCDSCGKDCKVPFKPTKGKPIYCTNCFKKQSGSRDSRGPRRESRSSDQFEALNRKLDKIIKLLEEKA